MRLLQIINKRRLFGFAGFLLLVFFWYAGVLLARVARPDLSAEVLHRLYPFPQDVARAAIDLFHSPGFVLHQVVLSTYRVSFGFVWASVLALTVGFLIGRVSWVATLLEPANDFLRYLPIAGFTSLAIFLLGTGNKSAILVVFLGTVFHLVVATADISRRVPAILLAEAHLSSYNWWRRVQRLILPPILPGVVDNLRVALGWAWSYVTMAEIMGTEGGMGYAIEVSRRYIRTDQVLLWLFLVGLLGLTSDQTVRFISRRLFHWATESVPGAVSDTSLSADQGDLELDPNVAIHLKSLSKSFRLRSNEELVIFSGLNLKIHRRNFVVILGPTGCGKSTLLRMIAGLETPTSGHIHLCPAASGGQPQIGFMFQQAATLPWRTVLGNVEQAIESRSRNRTHGATLDVRGQALDHISRVRLFGSLDMYPKELSGGMHQRLALARTLAMEPDVVLLDEPLSSLDSLTRYSIQNLIRDLHARDPRPYLMVTHDVDEALSLAQRLIVLGPAGSGVLFDSAVEGALPNREELLELVRGMKVTFAGGTWKGYLPVCKIASEHQTQVFEWWLGMNDKERLHALRSGAVVGVNLTIQSFIQLRKEMEDLDPVIVHVFAETASPEAAEHIIINPKSGLEETWLWASPGQGLEEAVIERLAPQAAAQQQIVRLTGRADCLIAVSKGEADACIADLDYASIVLGPERYARLRKKSLPARLSRDFWNVLVVSRSTLEQKHKPLGNAVRRLASDAYAANTLTRGQIHYPNASESLRLLLDGTIQKSFENWGGEGLLPTVTTLLVENTHKKPELAESRV